MKAALILHFSLAFGGIFLFLIFRGTNNGASLSIEAIRIVYGVFAGVTVLGMVFLVMLPMPESKISIYQCDFYDENDEKASLLKVMSKFGI